MTNTTDPENNDQTNQPLDDASDAESNPHQTRVLRFDDIAPKNNPHQTQVFKRDEEANPTSPSEPAQDPRSNPHQTRAFRLDELENDVPTEAEPPAKPAPSASSDIYKTQAFRIEDFAAAAEETPAQPPVVEASKPVVADDDPTGALVEPQTPMQATPEPDDDATGLLVQPNQPIAQAGNDATTFLVNPNQAGAQAGNDATTFLVNPNQANPQTKPAAQFKDSWQQPTQTFKSVPSPSNPGVQEATPILPSSAIPQMGNTRRLPNQPANQQANQAQGGNDATSILPPGAIPPDTAPKMPDNDATSIYPSGIPGAQVGAQVGNDPTMMYTPPNNQYSQPSNQYSQPSNQYSQPSNQYSQPSNPTGQSIPIPIYDNEAKSGSNRLLIGGIALLLLLGGLAAWFFLFRNTTPAINPTTVANATLDPNSGPAIQTEEAAPTRTPTATELAGMPTSAPTGLVPLEVALDTPLVQRVFTGDQLPYTLTLPIKQSDPPLTLADAQTHLFILRRNDQEVIKLNLTSMTADVLNLQLSELPNGLTAAESEPANAANPDWVLLIDDTVYDQYQVGFGETRTIKGITEDNAKFRSPLFQGKFAFPYSDPEQTESKRLKNAGMQNGEQVDILEVKDDWYKVRIRTNSDPTVVGQEVWILRWIVDNTNVPAPPPTTVPPTARPTEKPQPTAVPTPKPQPTPRPRPTAVPLPSYTGWINNSFPEAQGNNSGQNNSCINGTVLNRNGGPVAGAVGNVNNGGVFVQWQSNGAGKFSVCGLGYSNWAVVLDYAPPNGIAGQVYIPGIWVGGLPEHIAGVTFQER